MLIITVLIQESATLNALRAARRALQNLAENVCVCAVRQAIVLQETCAAAGCASALHARATRSARAATPAGLENAKELAVTTSAFTLK